VKRKHPVSPCHSRSYSIMPTSGDVKVEGCQEASVGRGKKFGNKKGEGGHLVSTIPIYRVFGEKKGVMLSGGPNGLKK